VYLVGTLYENNYQHFEKLTVSFFRVKVRKNFVVSECLQGLQVTERDC